MNARWFGCSTSGRFSRRRTWLSAATLGLLLISADSRISAQETAPQWYAPFFDSAIPADRRAEPPVRFVWTEENEPSASDGSSQRIRRAAFQNQYPLSKDSEDLLPGPTGDDRRSSRDWDEAHHLPSDSLFLQDNHEPCVPSDAEAPWIECEKTFATFTWISRGSSDGLGITSLEARSSLIFPDKPAFWIAPRIGVHSLNGPAAPDLPAHLFDASLEAVFMLPFAERWIVQAALAPSFFTDGDHTGHEAFRLPGRVLLFWNYSDTLTFTGGVLYLDRDDLKAIPSLGVIWKPNDDWKCELTAPRPRIARRLSGFDGVESWLYVVGEFGGGTWAIRRASGANDVVSLRDYRLMLGFEQKQSGHRSWLVEAGYVFGRRIEYTSGLGDVDLPSTAIVRVGMTF